MTINWETFTAFVLFVIAVTGFAWKVIDRNQKKKEKADEKRNQELINTIKEVNRPHAEQVMKLTDDNIDLKELADRSLRLHEQHEKNYNALDRRVLILEKYPNGAHTKVGYREIYESEGK